MPALHRNLRALKRTLTIGLLGMAGLSAAVITMRLVREAPLDLDTTREMAPCNTPSVCQCSPIYSFQSFGAEDLGVYEDGSVTIHGRPVSDIEFLAAFREWVRVSAGESCL